MSLQVTASAHTVSTEHAKRILEGSTMPALPSTMEIVSVLGGVTIARREKKYDIALKMIADILASPTLKPEHRAWTYLEKGLNLKMLGRFDEAASALDDAAKLGEHDTTGMHLHSTLYEQSKVLASLGRVEPAIKAILTAIDMVPKNDKDQLRVEQMRNRLGEFYAQKGDLRAAEDTLQSVAANQRRLYREKIDVELILTLTKLGEVYIKKGDLAQAQKLADEVVAMEVKRNQSKKDGAKKEEGSFSVETTMFLARLAERTDKSKAAALFYEALSLHQVQRPDHPIVYELECKLWELLRSR